MAELKTEMQSRISKILAEVDVMSDEDIRNIWRQAADEANAAEFEAQMIRLRTKKILERVAKAFLG